MTDELYLHEEVLLLALKDAKGTVELGSTYSLAVGAALLAELLLLQRVRTEGELLEQKIQVADSTPVGAPVLDDCLAQIADSKKPRGLEHWMAKFAQMKDLKRRVAERLCERGILRAEERKFLFVFSREVYPEVDPMPEERLRKRIREAVDTEREDIDPRTTIVVSLAYHTDLLQGLFNFRETLKRLKRIERITSGEATGGSAGMAAENVELLVVTVTAALIGAMLGGGGG